MYDEELVYILYETPHKTSIKSPKLIEYTVLTWSLLAKTEAFGIFRIIISLCLARRGYHMVLASLCLLTLRRKKVQSLSLWASQMQKIVLLQK